MSLLIADTDAETLTLGQSSWPMAIGKTGAIDAGQKREGDNKTPLGRYRCEALFYRADRLGHLHCALPSHVITGKDGWCDDSNDGAYNAHIMLPAQARHETLMRNDELYDALIVLSHNRWPAVPGYGSAIFLHVARESAGALAPTRGCLALKRADYLDMLKQLGPRPDIQITARRTGLSPSE